MHLMLQIATIQASPKICSLQDDISRPDAQNSGMTNYNLSAGLKLKLWREFRGLTQAALAEELDTSASVISLMENGQRKLSPDWLYKSAQVLGVSPGTLLDRNPGDLSSDFLTIFQQIPESTKQQALEILKTFVSIDGNANKTADNKAANLSLIN